MQYDIKLHISYEYEIPASGARHVVRILPATIEGRQRLVAGSVSFEPAPDEQFDGHDFFNNPVSYLHFRKSHNKSEILMRARVQVDARSNDGETSISLDDMPAALRAFTSLAPDAPHHFTGFSPLLNIEPEIAEYARRFAEPDGSVANIALALCRDIHARFKYDPEATSVDTPVRKAFQQKAGVCQDFAHVMISALRSIGVPAGYVSGFLRTIPPEGKPRLEGADAMHAWVRVWCGAQCGWLEYDPTNDMMAGTDHVVVAYGRDYSDVAPVIGTLRSYGSHKTVQRADVIPL